MELTWKAWGEVPHEQSKDGKDYTYTEAEYVAYREIVDEAASRERPPKLAASAFRWREMTGREEWPPWGWQPKGYPQPEPRTPDKASEYERQCVYAGLLMLQDYRGEEQWWADARFRAVFDSAPPQLPAELLVQQGPESVERDTANDADVDVPF